MNPRANALASREGARPLRRILQGLQRCASLTHPNVQLFHRGRALDTLSAGGLWAVFPASFNPPTEAHAAMVRWALDSGGFWAALLLLDLQHADKPSEDAVLPDRGLMMWRAFSSEDRIALGLCSHGRFLDKAEALRFLLGEDRSWYFLVGMDAMARILDPCFYEDPERDIRALFRQNGFVVFRRGGRWETVRRQMERWRKEGARIREAELPKTVRGVSSSQLRRRRARGLPLGPAVSPAVSRFIVRTGLYSADPRLVSRYERRKRRWVQMSRPVRLASPTEP